MTDKLSSGSQMSALPGIVAPRMQVPDETPAGDMSRAELFMALQKAEARLTAATTLANLGFYEVDFGEGLSYMDDRFRDLCGVPPECAHGTKPVEFWMAHLHPDDRRRVLDVRQQLQDGRLERVSVEYRFVHPVQGMKWIHHLALVATRDAAGHAVKTFGVVRDISERREAKERLRELNRRLIQANEEQRAQLARELHDDVTQRLAVLAIDVGRAELIATDGASAEAMRAIRETLVCLSEDVHSLAYQLHPSVLEELGLAEALRTECERAGRRSELALTAEIDPLPAMARSSALCLFRVAQEALSNVVHHAHARTAGITLRARDDGLLLTVLDDGIGFDPERRRRDMSLGLASMRERVELVGGRLEIESAPGRGTKIVALVPVEA